MGELNRGVTPSFLIDERERAGAGGGGGSKGKGRRGQERKKASRGHRSLLRILWSACFAICDITDSASGG